MSELITEDLVVLDVTAANRADVNQQIGQRLLDAGRVSDLDGFLADILAREEQMPTGLPGGIGIPHCRSPHVVEPTLGFARVAGGVDFGAEDGPANLIFMIAAPDGGGSEHLAILAKLARKLIHQDFRDSLLAAASPADVVQLISKEVGL
jgi:PTS system fructose-specific IIA component